MLQVVKTEEKMTPEQFIYWLSGALEYTNPDTISAPDAKKLLKGIQDHLALVITKVTPDVKKEKEDIFKGIDIDKIYDDIKKKEDAYPPYKTPWPSWPQYRPRDYYLDPGITWTGINPAANKPILIC